METTGEFYAKYPDLYDAFANDRDFANQCKSMLNVLREYQPNNENLIIAELFAGPARHSLGFAHLGCHVYSIDSEPSMKAYSIFQGFQKPENYLLGKIPVDKFNLPPIHLFTLLRYSVGYLDKFQLMEMIRWCNNHAHGNGLLIIELHIPEKILAGRIDIQTRKLSCEHGLLECTWPKSMYFDTQRSLILNMEVEIGINGVHYQFLSKEYMHVFDDIKLIAENLLNLQCFVVGECSDSFSKDSLIIGVILKGM